MKSSAKTVLMMGVAVLALTACSGTKGPGELGSKNDIVVRNHGEVREAAPAGDFSSTVENAAAVPPAEVGQGEPLAEAAPVAIESHAQAVAEQSAPVAPTTAAPMHDGTPSAAVSAAQQSAAETPIPAHPVTQSSAPVLQSEPYETPRVQTQPAVPPTVPAAPTHASHAAVPQGEPIPTHAAPQAQPVPQAAPVQEQAAVAVPKNPNASFYDYMKAGQTTGAGASSSTTSAAVTASGDVSKVKAALAAKGLYSGVANDTVDSNFLNALAKYQGENGLPMGGVNAQTIQHLGIAQ